MIQPLSRHVADLIAAGEVIERPASVVKELVENSVDAGATHIAVEIKRGGLELIRVTDDGGGIAMDELPTAFLRHATSKIRDAADLESITTLGFRGEALASVAAVAKVRVFSKRREAQSGAMFEISGSRAGELTDAGCPDGTGIFVEELFYNTPARHKFLKRDVTETGYCQAVVRRTALANPHIAFRMFRDGEEVMNTPGSGSLRDAVYASMGGVFAAGLSPVSSEYKGVTVTGYTSKAENSQGNRTRQEYFVNGRPVRSRMLTAAAEEAYKGAIMQGRFPACVLCIALSPTQVDVNVHPSKLEVKFADERAVFDAVYLAIKAVIDKSQAAPIVQKAVRPEHYPGAEQSTIPQSAGFSPVGRVDTSKVLQFYETLSQSAYKARYAPESGQAIADHSKEQAYVRTQQGGHRDDVPKDGDNEGRFDNHNSGETGAMTQRVEFDDASAGDSGEFDGAARAAFAPLRHIEHVAQLYEASPPALPRWRIAGEVLATYIIVEENDEILFIDKHAAHERIIFNELAARGQDPLSQTLIEPAVFTPTTQERDALDDNRELIRNLGFEIDDFGGGSLIIRAVPSDIAAFQATETLEEIAESLRNYRRKGLLEKRQEALRLVACKAALKAGSVTSHAEIYALCERVLNTEDIRHCPHGRPVVSVLKRSELERRMGRLT